MGGCGRCSCCCGVACFGCFAVVSFLLPSFAFDSLASSGLGICILIGSYVSSCGVSRVCEPLVDENFRFSDSLDCFGMTEQVIFANASRVALPFLVAVCTNQFGPSYLEQNTTINYGIIAIASRNALN